MLDLDAIEAAEKAMTPGPWERDYGGTVGHIKSVANRDDGSTPTVLQYDVKTPSLTPEERIANATGIALLRNAAPDLTRRIREQEAVIAELRALCGDAAFHAANHLSLATAISYQPGDAGMAEHLPDIRANRDRLRAASKGEQ